MSVCKTTDEGFTWTRYNLSPEFGYAYAIAIDPTNSDIVYAGGDPELYKTTNHGDTWSPSSTGLTGYTYAIAMNPQNTSIIYAGTSDGIFESTDAGVVWRYNNLDDVYTIVIDPDSPDTIYAGTVNGMYRSTSGGSTWDSMGLDGERITSLGIYPDAYLYAGTYSGGMYRWDLSVGIAEQDLTEQRKSIFALPNPTRGRTTIHYSLPKATHVNLSIYDIQGRLICTVINEVQPAGKHTALWNAVDKRGIQVSAGIYFYRLATEETTQAQKIILLK